MHSLLSSKVHGWLFVTRILLNCSIRFKQSALLKMFLYHLADDYPSASQTAQLVQLPIDSSAQKTVNLTIEDDTILECNETFTFTLESFSGQHLLTIDPAGNHCVVTIIDDDGLFPRFCSNVF